MPMGVAVEQEALVFPPDALVREVEYLHALLFGRAPPPLLVDAYLRAHTLVPAFRNLDPLEQRTVATVVRLRLDALGIEVWLRRPRTRHALSAKLLAIAYLAECGGSHPEFARSWEDGAATAWHIPQYGLRGLFRLATGAIQKVRHGLV